MQALQAVMLVGRAGILRSARLPRPMAVVAGGMDMVLLQEVSVAPAEASVRRAQMRPLQGLMAVVVVVVARLLRAPAP